MKPQFVTQELAVSKDSRVWKEEQTLENLVNTTDPARPAAAQEALSRKTSDLQIPKALKWKYDQSQRIPTQEQWGRKASPGLRGRGHNHSQKPWRDAGAQG